MKCLWMLALLPLTGCNNIFLVNVGGVTKQASSTNHPLAPEVQCAALAGKVEMNGMTVDAMEACINAVKEQRELDRKGNK